MLLPPLARLLDTDLNTLLSFKEELTRQEIALFINAVTDRLRQNGFEQGFLMVKEKLKEYPNSDLLIINCAMVLSGSLYMQYDQKLVKLYEEKIDELFLRVSNSSDTKIAEEAKSHLISRYIKNGEITKAQELLDTIDVKSSVDLQRMQAKIYIGQEKYEKAAQVLEEKLLTDVQKIQDNLLTLMDIAICQNRFEDAKYIADVSQQCAKSFDLWKYNEYAAHFQLYLSNKDIKKLFKILIPMLRSLTQKWDLHQSPLYRHVITKEIDSNFGKEMQKNIINAICNEPGTEFLKEDEEFQEIVKKVGL